MIFCRANAEYIPQKPGMGGIWEKIEAGARTCYKTEGKTVYDEAGNSITAERFASKIVNVYKHQSVAEHATVYMMLTYHDNYRDVSGEPYEKYIGNPYSRVNRVEEAGTVTYYITTNYRVILENGWEDDLKYMCQPTPYHYKRLSIRVWTDRGVSAEANRHRKNSPSERSTRYVSYSPESKTTGGMRVLVPESIKDEDIENSINGFGGDTFREMCKLLAMNTDNNFNRVDAWLFANLACEWSYNRMLSLGCTPQEARRVLPLDIETELVITAYEDDWDHFFDLRLVGTTGKPHPDMQHLASLMYKELKRVGYTYPNADKIPIELQP